jgi:hypothetical protein
VVAECDVTSADCTRSEVVAQEAHHEQGDPEPCATLVCQDLLTSAARLGRRGLRLDLRGLYVWCRCGWAAVRRDGILCRLLRREVRDVALAFVFHVVLRESAQLESPLADAFAITPARKCVSRRLGIRVLSSSA